MTYHRPKFEQGLFGSANRFVCNRWSDGAEFTMANAEGVAWAQQQIVRGSVLSTHLCQVESATVLAANRWIYTVKQWVPAAIAGSAISNPTDERFKYTTCRNIREEHNTATLVDGMDITTPAASVGPVGSVWSGAAWTTTNLSAKLLVHVVYDLGGNAYAFFDRPNPVRCTT